MGTTITTRWGERTGSERERVMVLAPDGRDATLAIELLARHGLTARQCQSADELAAGMDHAGCAIVTQEALDATSLLALEQQLRAQPAWSDFPFILVVLAAKRAPARAWQSLGNVTVLERPTRSRTLLSAVNAALRARRRQYEAQQAIAHRDQFLAMLGHELRNPLAAISLATEAERLERGGGSGKDEADPAHRCSEIIARQARHLTRLVDDLLDAARVTTGKVVLNSAPLDVAAMLARCVQSVELSARDHSIEIEIVPPPAGLTVRGDGVRLDEVLVSLLSNAIKYSPPHSSVKVRARAEGDQCVLEVEDEGIGICADMLPRVFDLFAQAEVSLDRSRGGLGIGLTLVKSLVELHGGSVRAESDGLGRGSTFSARLPLIDQGELPAPSSHHIPSGRLSLRVLVIDDNADLLEMMQEVLESFGCEVQTALDGPSGLERLGAFEPALAFIDIGLPGLDGYALAREVRARETRGPWLVALTGYGQPEDRQRALDAGFDQHMTKPVSVSALRQAIDEAGGASRQRSA